MQALLGALVVLLVLSAFFSGSETSMMAVNRYRLKTLAQAGHRGARLAENLLARTDKLLAVILLGNNLVNAAAASLVTVIAFRLFGESEWALTAATLSVTFLILVFSEVTPKVIGATWPERLVPVISFPLTLLQKLMMPVIWFINLFVRGQLRLFRLNPGAATGNNMGVEELRTLLSESGGLLPTQHRDILMNLFELQDITVDDAMLPRGQIEALDLAEAPGEILRQLLTSHHSRLPVYEGEANNIVGVVHVRRILARLREAEEFDVDALRALLREPYFIPAGTSLFSQLTQFQATRQTMGLVVDEYGELLGLVTVEDILEEIVGEFTAVLPGGQGNLREDDGSFLVDGMASLRELNRKLGLDFPVDGPRTLNGLLLEHLEAMPEAGVSVMLAGYPVEVVQVQDRIVKTARIGPRRA